MATFTSEDSHIDNDLFTYDDNTTVLVVLWEWLDCVTVRINLELRSRDTFLLQCFSNLFSTLLCIFLVNLGITSASVGITIDCDNFVGVFLTPFGNLLYYLFLIGIQICLSNLVERVSLVGSTAIAMA